MEDNVQVLSAVCTHFTQYRSQELVRMRKQKARAHSECYRLRRRVAQLKQQLEIERMLARNLQTILYRASTRLEAIARSLAELFH